MNKFLTTAAFTLPNDDAPKDFESFISGLPEVEVVKVEKESTQFKAEFYLESENYTAAYKDFPNLVSRFNDEHDYSVRARVFIINP